MTSLAYPSMKPYMATANVLEVTHATTAFLGNILA
jgi:hypothetical protein